MTAIYPGTFDPLTNGHLDIIERGAKMFNHLLVAIAENPGKNPLFTLEERVDSTISATKHLPNVNVEPFSCLLSNFMQKKKINVLLRGLRAVSDFEYELQLALMNRQLNEECETVFLMPNMSYIFLSSSMIREIARLGGDVKKFVPDSVERLIAEKFN
ncbi:Phosphopantetheine adenylyltransferase [Flexistipes sinusarabici DSM 4947]|uniref:Phosphopantetheine adenylyltransferase n=1 Tax=Flexistipes sinusarabici (strain ATCC 49648 / DSM 4947 / MAS 10) TaxID=717231 RepID=F8E795_FLESM|nr:pantetheine-phosphate adenylyltransferase [Flexistipes sinusarabici]AEI13810.1 Phosphopantetheine adenylyltransferase [Flexistipes sinusarabici DSM 4947]